MASTGKCLLWLTALTTTSWAMTGCTDSGHPATAAPTTSAHPVRPSHAVAPAHPHHREPTVTATPSPVALVTTRPQASVLVISDGSAVVRVGGRDVHFPGPVTDAAVSPNGLDIAFVDGLGNIAVGRLDGSRVRALTSTDPRVRRAQPTFEDGGSEIVFSERGHDGVWRLKEVAADGHDQLTDGSPDPTLDETQSDGGHDTAPNATWFQASHADTARSVLAFEHRTARGVTKVYVADRNQRGFGATPLLPGHAPAVSPSGDRVAFIGATGQIFVERLRTDTPRADQITWGARPTGHLAWSPDGRRLFFSTARDVEAVSSTPVSPGRNPVQVVLSRPGVPSLGTVTQPTVGLFAGTDPVHAAVAVSRSHYVGGTQLPMDESGAYGISWADHVTLLSTDDPSAAAPAAVLAHNGPILFLRGGRLDPEVRDEIVRLLDRPHGFHLRATVDVVGTATDIPDTVVTELRDLGFRVRRFSPDDAAGIAAHAALGRYDTYVVVSKDDLPAVASARDTVNPILLTDGSIMPTETARKLDHMIHSKHTPATVYAVGAEAQAAVRSSWTGKGAFQVIDVGGSSVGSTSLAAMQVLYDSPGRLSVTAATDWQDGLIAGMAAPTFVLDGALTRGATAWLAASQPVMRSVYVLGSATALAGNVGRAVYGDRYEVDRTPNDITQ
jgi:hypothetical protein